MHIDQLAGLAGEGTGLQRWVEVSQDKIDGFADATDDYQWIHLDPVRAADGPFGGLVAHGI